MKSFKQYINESKARMNEATAVPTARLNASGGRALVLAWPDDRGAKTFSNRTQADKAAKKVGGKVIKPGRVFYVMIDESINEADLRELKIVRNLYEASERIIKSVKSKWFVNIQLNKNDFFGPSGKTYFGILDDALSRKKIKLTSSGRGVLVTAIVSGAKTSNEARSKVQQVLDDVNKTRSKIK